MSKKIFTLFLNLMVWVFLVFGQNTYDENISNTNKSNTKTQNAEALPTGFRGIVLGLDIETVKDSLKTDKVFGYRGERDISLLTIPNRSSIETSGSSFISRAWFQFYEETLYTITLKLNTEKIDYYSIYSHFVKKYGEPLDINPKRAIWENETTRITIERPLSVKYLDLTVFNSLLEKSGTEKAESELNRESFIDAF